MYLLLIRVDLLNPKTLCLCLWMMVLLLDMLALRVAVVVDGVVWGFDAVKFGDMSSDCDFCFPGPFLNIKALCLPDSYARAFSHLCAVCALELLFVNFCRPRGYLPVCDSPAVVFYHSICNFEICSASAVYLKLG